ncbi:MAG: hypothetical protein IPQ19_12780 [Bacteroidetes bacterium]|nr:hypothetical protein [Bacteroidota bacterium]
MKKWFAYFMLFTLLLGACKKEDKLLQNAPLSKAGASTALDGFTPGIKNGRLVFPNSETMGNYILSLQKLDEKTIIGKHRGFQSHWEIMNLVNSGSFTEAQLSETAAIYDPFLASVLNKNREAQIADFIYQAGNDYCFLFFEKDRAVINRFLNDVKSGAVSLNFGKIFMYNNILCWKTGGYGNQARLSGGQIGGNEKAKEEKDEFNNKKRMKSKFWETNWLVYASSGAKTKTQKKEWFIWNALNATTVEVIWDVDMATNLYEGQPQPFSFIKNLKGTQTKSNDHISKIIFDAVTATIGVSTNIQSGSTSPTGAPASLMFGVFNYGTHISTTKHRAVWNSITKNRTLTW